IPRPPPSTLLPYTTLFRSRPQSARSAPDALDTAAGQLRDYGAKHRTPGVIVMNLSDALGVQHLAGTPLRTPSVERQLVSKLFQRSEEHTSELQSRGQLV